MFYRSDQTMKQSARKAADHSAPALRGQAKYEEETL